MSEFAIPTVLSLDFTICFPYELALYMWKTSRVNWDMHCLFFPHGETIGNRTCSNPCAYHKLLAIQHITVNMNLFYLYRFETEGTQLPCKAVINLSDLRIPLMWKDSDHFKNKGGMCLQVNSPALKMLFLQNRDHTCFFMH